MVLDAAALCIPFRTTDTHVWASLKGICPTVDHIQNLSFPQTLSSYLQVKSLLEAGLFLHSPMLAGVLEHVATFTKSCGLMRFNKYILAVLTFVAKCVGHNDSDLESMVDAHGICIVVYGTMGPPSRATISPPVVVAAAATATNATTVASASAAAGADGIGSGPSTPGDSPAVSSTTVEAVVTLSLSVTQVVGGGAGTTGGGKASVGVGKGGVRGRSGLGSDIKLKVNSVAPSTQGTPRIGGS